MMKRYILFSIGWLFVLTFLRSVSFSQSKGGRWQFEHNGLDTADWDAVENNGLLQNGASYSSNPPLQEGTAYLWLDSSQVHDFFRIDDNDDLDFDDEDIGISAWVYPIVLNDVHWIVNKGDQYPNPKTTNYAIRISISKKLEFLIRDANNKAQTVTSSFTIPLNQWTFVAIFYDYSEGKVYLWNDPSTEPVDTLDFNQRFFSNDDPLSIGSWYTSDPLTPSLKDFEGRIDDVRISGRIEDIIPNFTSVDSRHIEPKTNVPTDISIFPNPVSLSQKQQVVTMQFELKHPEEASIRIFNILGQQIFTATMTNQKTRPTFRWNLRNDLGNLVNAGIYFVKLESRGNHSVKKLIVIK